MKRKVYFLILLLGLIGLIGSCRGFKSAPPCPAYTSVGLSSIQNHNI
jgi:hypothetical protein